MSGAPCLILATFAKVELDAAALAEIAGASLAAFAGFAAIGFAVLRRVPAQHSRLSAGGDVPARRQHGAPGLPVRLRRGGARPGAGVLRLRRDRDLHRRRHHQPPGRSRSGRIARSPVFYAAALAIGMEAGGIALPRWAFNAADLLGGIVIPMQLVALGVALARLRVASLGPQHRARRPAGWWRARWSAGRWPRRSRARPGRFRRGHPAERDAGRGLQLPVRPDVRPASPRRSPAWCWSRRCSRSRCCRCCSPCCCPSPHFSVRRGKAPTHSGCEPRPATVAPAGSNRSG